MNMTVSQILNDKHGISAQAGKRVECPFCRRRTFSVKRDDSLGKCFHPDCGRFIRQGQNETTNTNGLHEILEEIFYDFHAELLGLKDTAGKNAWSYLTVDRRIHPQVIEDSMLGVIPAGYDLRKKFTSLIKRAKRASGGKQKTRKGGRGRPKNHKDISNKAHLETIFETQEKLERCIKRNAGWLCFFYTDAGHRIVAIRFRKPYSKKILYFKPFKSVAGLFGHGLFTPYHGEGVNEFNNLLIVTEGEFNQLQLQSMILRCGEQLKRPAEYLSACAVGGVSNADYETIKKVAKNPVICYDNDTGGAGFKLVERAQELMSVTAFTTPEPDSDLDDYISSFGEDHKAAWDAVRSLVGNRKAYPRSFESMAKDIRALRRNERKQKAFEVEQQVAEAIKSDLLDRGSFYNDSQRAYFFFEVEKRLIEISPDQNEFTAMLDRYSINRSEKLYSYLFEALRVEALERGQRTEIHRLSSFNPKTFTVFLFNQNNQIYRITADAVDLVDNGMDGVLFLTDRKSEEFRADEPEAPFSWLDKVINSKINFAEDMLTPDERRLVFTLWFYSLFFESILPTKPILAFIGEKGSGKSITLRKVGMLLFGDKFNVTPLTEKPEDFDAAVANSAFVAIDNADTGRKWLEDKLATVATGGSIKKRELYTTNNMVDIPVRCFLGITSRTPCFRRDDVADRLLIMKVKRFNAYLPESSLLSEVLENRDAVMSEVVSHIQEILQALQTYRGYDGSGAFRMADFADFAMKVAKHTGVEMELEEIYSKLNREQSVFTLEVDPLIDLLWHWAKENHNRDIGNTELCLKLSELASKKGLEFSFRGNPRGFAQKMSQLRPNLEQFFEISEREAGGRKKLFTYAIRV